MGTIIGWVEPKSKPKAEKAEEPTPVKSEAEKAEEPTPVKSEAEKAPAKAKKK